MTRIEIDELLNEQVMQTSETCNLVENMQLTMTALATQLENMQTDQRQQNKRYKKGQTCFYKFYVVSVVSWMCYIFYRVIESVYYAKKMNRLEKTG
jgi:hypothetical protein